MKAHPKISFVIIGRNEAAHLSACITSVLRVNYPADKKEIIFVDNHSTDDSLAIARRFPLTVIALQQQPATPGLARNVGLRAARGEFVQFIDGDMMLHPDWITTALPTFEDQRLAAVVGRLREVNPQKSFYNRLFDFNWKLAPSGEIESPGGGGFFRVSALRQADGYDETLFASEEVDLGYRLQQNHFKLMRLPALMADHDMHMQSFRHFWRRGVRDGYWVMAVIRKYFNWTWPLPEGYIFKMDVQLLAFIALAAGLVAFRHPILAALLFILPVAFILKKAWYFYRASSERKMSLWAAVFNYIIFLPTAWGQLRYLLAWRSVTKPRRSEFSRHPVPSRGNGEPLNSPALITTHNGPERTENKQAFLQEL